MKLWKLLTRIKVQQKQTFLCTGDSIFNLTNYTVIVQSSRFTKNLGLQIKNLAGNSFPGRSTQWWLTNRVRRTSLALWDRAKWTCRISLHARGALRFWCRRVRSMSTCACSRQLLLLFGVSRRAETTVMGRIIITVDDWLVQNFKERGISGNRAIVVLSCNHAASVISTTVKGVGLQTVAPLDAVIGLYTSTVSPGEIVLGFT